MNQERDSFLTKIIGECEHDWKNGERCFKCNSSYFQTPYPFYKNSFSDWNDFGKLLTWLKKQKLWQEIRWNMPMAEFMDLVTDPDKAATRLYEYLRSKTNGCPEWYKCEPPRECHECGT